VIYQRLLHFVIEKQEADVVSQSIAESKYRVMANVTCELALVRTC